jgi:bifunctional non-homologous end joining protein LigD
MGITSFASRDQHDGFRMMVRRDAAGVQLLTRNGNDWTDRYPLIAEAAGALQVRSFLIDGGRSPATGRACRHSTGCATAARNGAVFLFAFDLLKIDGQDLRREALEVRKCELGKLLRWTAQVGLQFNEHRARRRGVPARL